MLATWVRRLKQSPAVAVPVRTEHQKWRTVSFSHAASGLSDHSLGKPPGAMAGVNGTVCTFAAATAALKSLRVGMASCVGSPMPALSR